MPRAADGSDTSYAFLSFKTTTIHNFIFRFAQLAPQAFFNAEDVRAASVPHPAFG
jgi:hypothetical protein